MVERLSTTCLLYTSRDKTEVGQLVGQYVDVIIASGFNEVNQTVEMDAAYEVLDLSLIHI